MSNTQLNAILPQIHRLFSLGVTTGVSDRVLFHRYCTGQDKSAFAVLVARHGPMVPSVCRSVLRHEFAAEDREALVLCLLRGKAQVEAAKLPHTIGGRGFDRPVFPIDRDGRFPIEGLIAGPPYTLEAF